MKKTVKVEGSNEALDYSEVSTSIVKIGEKYYWRSDNSRVVRVEDKMGARRYYRKESPLICYCGTNSRYELRENCALTDEGVWLLKNSSSTVEIDGKFYKKQFTVYSESSKRYYLISDPQIVKLNNGKYELKTNTIQLSEKYYKSVFVLKYNNPDIIETEDGWIFKHDACILLNLNEEKIVHFSSANNKILVKLRFKDPSTPTTNNMEVAYSNETNPHLTQSTILGGRVLKSNKDLLEGQYLEYVEKQNRVKIESIRKTINKNYSEKGPDENTASIISFDYERFPGNRVLFAPSHNSPVLSNSIRKTGGIGYTFGVEIETSAGILNNTICENARLTKVGDGSIGSAEYVTPPLHGNNGIKLLSKAVKYLSENTLVDDRCAIHVHVGGHEKTDSPTFDDEFLYLAIKLGVLVEEDFYRISPTSRLPDYKHCHSIKSYSGITEKNWKQYVGRYIFGPREGSSSFSLDGYDYGQGDQTRNANLGLYPGGKYKWLNLINAATATSINTCELRMFGGTTSFDKIYNYVLISLAFVKFIENNRNNIMDLKTLSIHEMVTDSIRIDTIQKQVLKFIDDRIVRFNREDIYNNIKKQPLPTIAADF